MTPAALYVRQSRTRDGSESIPEQLAQCRREAERLGLQVVAELIEADSTSASKNRGRDRKRWKELLDLVRSGKVQAVVAYKTDRLNRGGGPGWAPLLEALEAQGIDVDRAIATAGSGFVREFEIGIRAAMDREEAKKLSDRMLAIRAREAAAGKPQYGGGRPFGFDADHRTVRPSEAALIREAATRVIQGERPWAICQDWNTRGLVTTSGGHWSDRTLRSILVRPRVAGLREHRGEVVGEGGWAPIIDRTTWERITAVLVRRPVRPAPRTFALVGFAYCGVCGRRMKSASAVSKRRYVCQKNEAGEGCGSISIKAEWLEADVFEVVAGTVLDPEALTRLVAAAPGDDGPDLHAESAGIEAQREKLLDAYMDGLIPKDAFGRRGAQLDAELAALYTKMAARGGREALVGLPRTLEGLTEAWGCRGIDWQRAVIEAVMERVTITAGRQGSRVFDQGRLAYTLR